MFLYKPNINLVLGSQWQPLVFGVADDGKNLAIELTRIPNSPNVYQQIYTDYTGTNSSYKGGTCSVYWCGGAGNGNSVNATHSSISIGSVDYTAATATKPLSLEAYKGADSVGVSFGSLMAVQGTTLTNTGSNTTTANVTQARWIQRTNNADTTWTYRNAIGGTRTGTANQWAYNGTVVNPLTGVTNATYEAFSTRYRYPIASGNDNTWSSNTTTPGLCGDSNCTYYGTINNRNWTVADMKGLSWSAADNAGLDSWLQSQGSTTRANVAANQAATPALPTVAQPTFSTVNLGSAVIDGMLIQHMKITTKGL